MERVSLAELASGQASFTLDGEPVKGPKSEGKVIWAEVVLGSKDAEGKWVSFQHLHNTEGTLDLASDSQSAELFWRKMRPHIAPTHERVFESAEGAPPPVVAWLKDHPAPAYMTEYALIAGKTYYGQVEIETFSLPPKGPGERPGTGRNTIFIFSDQPWVDDKPVGELTPMFAGWTY